VVEGQGLIVTHILPDGRAEKVGLKEQDVIQKVNGKDVHSTHDLRKLVTENPKGLVIEGLRDGKPLKLEEKDK
jgi:S1-C subfamily serine protease